MAEAADDLDVVIDAAALWLAAGRHVALATVIETWGSAPRRAGSHLVIRDDGIFEGSVSGGCVEGDVIVQALELIAAGGGFRRLDYGVADAQAWEVGLACGGRIRSEEHTSELQSLMRISYDVFCLKKKKEQKNLSILT